MTRPTDTDEYDYDLAQLLMLEAGRILEDLTTELAQRLPEDPIARRDALDGSSAKVSDAAQLLLTARQVARHKCPNAN